MMFNLFRKKKEFSMTDVMRNLKPKFDTQQTKNQYLSSEIKMLEGRIEELSKELHGWQSSMYHLMNALNLDLVLDENGIVKIQSRKVRKNKWLL